MKWVLSMIALVAVACSSVGWPDELAHAPDPATGVVRVVWTGQYVGIRAWEGTPWWRPTDGPAPIYVAVDWSGRGCLISGAAYALQAQYIRCPGRWRTAW